LPWYSNGCRIKSTSEDSGIDHKKEEWGEQQRHQQRIASKAGLLHAIIKASAPVLSPRLLYGMPAYAKDGRVVFFFQSMEKFKTRYATVGFMHEANLDEGNMWPTAFALKKVTAAEEEKIAALVKKAVS
jgi:uncharacterized protein YdhG (YjbR/CyaY superfamily)